MNWQSIKENTAYEISDNGKIRNKKTGRILKPWIRKGYCIIKLSSNEHHSVHRLVASAFIGDITGKEVDHIDRVRHNNNVNNLRIVDASMNISNRSRFGVGTISLIINLHESGMTTEQIYQAIR